MLPEYPQPFTSLDLARLDHFLRSAACGTEAMGLPYAHGFLTVVASGPEQLESSEWLRLMFDEPVFDSGAEGEEMLGLALRLFAEIERGLRGECEFWPIFNDIRDASGDIYPDAQPWCRGFVAGISLFNEMWTPQAHRILQHPLKLICELAEIRALPDSAYRSLCDVVPSAAESVYRFWRHAGSSC